MIQTTSRIAFREVKAQLGDRQKRVYDELKVNGPMTNSEIAVALKSWVNTITPRISELRKMGLVDEACKRPCRITGRTAIAWEVIQNTLF